MYLGGSMPYLEDRLPKQVKFEIKPVGLKWGVYEPKAGCVFIGTAAEVRAYQDQRRVKEELKIAERGLNPEVSRYGVIRDLLAD
jgi:hypothetical protein